MSTKFHAIAAAVLLSLGSLSSAQAQASRAEVVADLDRAIASGELDAQRAAYHDGTPAITTPAATGARGRALAPSGLTREQVRAELMRARASGELDDSREAAGDGTAARTMRPAAGAQGRAFAAPGLTREQVRAEVERARASGELNRMPFEHGGH